MLVSAAAGSQNATYWLRPSRWNAESPTPGIASHTEANRRRREERLTRGAGRPLWGPKPHSDARRDGISESITFAPRRSILNHPSQSIFGGEMMSLIAPCPQKAQISDTFALAMVTPTGEITMASEAKKFRCLDRVPPKPLYQWARPILIPAHRPRPDLAGVSFVIGLRRLSVIQYCGLSPAT